MIGVKEVPIENLLPNKKYFYFSHTIKKQPYNQKLLRAVLDKKIELYDHETIVNEEGFRLIGFGRYAGLVGAYNGFRALGLRDDLFELPKVETLADLDSVKAELDKITLPKKLNIILSGNGKVARGAKEILDHLGIKAVSHTLYLTKEFTEPVYCLVDVLQYVKRTDGKVGDKWEFFKDPSGYESNFMPYAKQTDYFIAGHFYGNNAPYLFTREDAKHPDFKINLVEVIIYNLVEGIFFAKLICELDGKEVEIDSRTSDAIALAVRFESPIYTYEFVLNSAGIILDDEELSENDNITPEINLEDITNDPAERLTLKELKKQLKNSIENEDYEAASRFRDEINKRKEN